MNLITSFLEYLKFERRSSQYTLKAYNCDLEQFLFYLETEEVNGFTSVNTKNVRFWIVSLHEQGFTPKTISRKITSLKSFYNFLLREEIIDNNPLDGIKSPKIPKRLPNFVRNSEMSLLLDNINFTDDYIGKRDKLILELFYGSGMRLSELVSLRIQSFDTKQGIVKVLGKFNKERIIPLYNELRIMIDDYVDIRNQTYSDSDIECFFLTKKGQPVYHKLIYRVVNKYLSLITTAAKKSPHVLRHSFATALLNNGADINAIKELLGHANLNATQVYTHNSFEKINNIYKQAHPRA